MVAPMAAAGHANGQRTEPHTPTALLNYLRSLSHPSLSTDGPKLSNDDVVRFTNIALSLSQFLASEFNVGDDESLDIASEALELIDKIVSRIPSAIRQSEAQSFHLVVLARLLEFAVQISSQVAGGNGALDRFSVTESRSLDVAVHIVRVLCGNLSLEAKERGQGWEVVSDALHACLVAADSLLHHEHNPVMPLEIKLIARTEADALSVETAESKTCVITITSSTHLVPMAFSLLSVISGTLRHATGASAFLSAHEAKLLQLICTAWDSVRIAPHMHLKDSARRTSLLAKLLRVTETAFMCRLGSNLPSTAVGLCRRVERFTMHHLGLGSNPSYEECDRLLRSVWKAMPLYPVFSSSYPLEFVLARESHGMPLTDDFNAVSYAYLERSIPYLSSSALLQLPELLSNAPQTLLDALSKRLQESQPDGINGTTSGKRKRDDYDKAPSPSEERTLLKLFAAEGRLPGDGLEHQGTSTPGLLLAIDNYFARPLAQCSSERRETLAEGLSNAVCVLVHPGVSSCSSTTGNSVPAQTLGVYLRSCIHLLDGPMQDVTPSIRTILLNGLRKAVKHSSMYVFEQAEADVIASAKRGMEREERSVRLSAGKVLAEVFMSYRMSERDVLPRANLLMDYLIRLIETHSSAMIKETTLIAIAAIGRYAPPEIVARAVACLIAQLGHENSIIKALAYTKLQGLAESRHKSLYSLIAPYLPQVSIFLVQKLVSHPQLLTETCLLIGMGRIDFLSLTLNYCLPPLVAKGDRTVIEAISKELGKHPAAMCLQAAHEILAHVFLCNTEAETDKGLDFFLTVVGEAAGKGAIVSAATLVKSCLVPLLSELVMVLGHEDQAKVQLAAEGLKRVERHVALPAKGHRRPAPVDLPAFLRAHVLGIISHLNDILQDVQGRKTVSIKKQVIRSLASLIEMVGPTISSVSPQIMATLQSMLAFDSLREATLTTWRTFITTLAPNDAGSYVGQTSAAFVAEWDKFDAVECELAQQTLGYLIQHCDQFRSSLSDMVSLNHIPALSDLSEKLSLLRAGWNAEFHLGNLLERASTENVTVALRALEELKHFMSSNTAFILGLSSGDAFDPAVGRLVEVLFSASTRDGEACENLRLLAYECLGMLGAVDPDRFSIRPDDVAVVVLHNFEDENENVAFVLHLIRDLLVGAFRSTSDIKYQSHLAFAIQELMKICNFGPELAIPGASSSIPLKIRQRWNSLPKHILETIAPLLEGRFTLNNKPLPPIQHPVYASTPTYREWIQVWTAYLITRVSASQAKRIFEVFRSAVRNQDVGVAHHLLPHVVLNVLVTGDEEDCDHIRTEIVTVLEDQVSPHGGEVTTDRRMLSAQTIFSLMDHLSKWIRLLRQESNQKRSESARYRQGANWTSLNGEAESQLARVESMLSSIDQELMARAALHCRSFARALLSFEQRVVSLHDSGLDNVKLQPYYENLHKIYAELDEPDGMAGVSTKVMSPSLEHQIREHEAIGKWTSAQSCWEVKLQGSPDDIESHLGLLRCLRNLGHYDTLRTHVKGVVSRRPEWLNTLAGFQAEGAWMVGDWADVEQLSLIQSNAPELYIAKLLLAIRGNDARAISHAFDGARRRLGDQIMSAGKHSYRGAYDVLVSLHFLHELQVICAPSADLSSPSPSAHDSIPRLADYLSRRFELVLPTFRAREPILSIRRTAFGLRQPFDMAARVDVGRSWLTTARIARKAGYIQTAYSAVLQAGRYEAPFAFIQTCKLLRVGGEPIRALQELENALAGMNNRVIDLSGDQPPDISSDDNRAQAKALALDARWMNEADRYNVNDIAAKFNDASKKAPRLESPYFHLGHFWDETFARLSSTQDKLKSPSYNFFTCKAYAKALSYGSKYIYQTMPRMLTLWLDMADPSETNVGAAGDQTQHNVQSVREKITDTIEKVLRRLPPWQWLTAFPQIVSRIGHPNAAVFNVLAKIMVAVLREYPQQALWLLTSASKSKKPDRAKRCDMIFKQAQAGPGSARSHLSELINTSITLTTELLNLSDFAVPPDQHALSLSRNFRELRKLAPCRLILPLQDSMTVTLPPVSASQDIHQPFPKKAPIIQDFLDEIEVMRSLQRPRTLTIVGDDGKTYKFLCKPKDDLRKDARLMDFNSMINKLLNTNSESRRRQLRIRTYGVIPLNEECGCLEWVPNTVALRSILNKAYEARKIKIFSGEISTLLEAARVNNNAGAVFEKEVLPRFPPVFHEWFISTFPEPTAWLSSRLSYARTAAVMSMVGYVLGLGDRHGENILFDYLTGDTVHVDLNCLFEKGRSFEIPERVPFRLTQNMVDGLGITGVEGVFRIASELTMDVLRRNKDSLMSVLEAFVHDPLSEWEEEKRKQEREVRSRQAGRARRGNGRTSSDGKVLQLRELAQRSLEPIARKLKGVYREKETSTSSQVESLIREATNSTNLGLMYVGWGAWL